ncbi:hypothetical protein KBC79_01960 [Candidatus Woesebacteria bacterium]|nr:hypothetical protein [Candidatus Woesebacteria bacterium]
MANIKPPEKISEFPVAVVKNMILLSTSGFGVVVALAWNELIKAIVEQYLDPLLGKGGGVISLLVYAVVMTLLAVLVTMQLAAIEKRFDPPQEIKKKSGTKR